MGSASHTVSQVLVLRAHLLTIEGTLADHVGVCAGDWDIGSLRQPGQRGGRPELSEDAKAWTEITFTTQSGRSCARSSNRDARAPKSEEISIMTLDLCDGNTIAPILRIQFLLASTDASGEHMPTHAPSPWRASHSYIPMLIKYVTRSVCGKLSNYPQRIRCREPQWHPESPTAAAQPFQDDRSPQSFS